MGKASRLFEDIEGFVDFSIDPYQEGARSPFPSINFIFGNTHLIPWGASVIFWGPPKGGKSLLTNFIAGQVQQDDPDAIVVKFNTEQREHFQMNTRSMKLFGIDPKRYFARNSSKASDVFNFIEKDIPAAIQKGHKIKLVIIDSITDVMGRRMENADTVDKQQIGDDAATIKDGLKRIRDTIRKYGITLLMVAQERAELDQVEIMRGKKVKMAGAYYLRHFAEYFVYVRGNEAKDGRVDLLGNKFEVASLQDIDGNNEVVASKIKVQMKASSVGVAGRVGEFTFHKFLGAYNIHEEVFRLGVARNTLEMPNNRSYVLPNWPEGKDSKWGSREDMLMAIKNDPELSKEIVKRIRLADIEMYNKGIDVDYLTHPDTNGDVPEFEGFDAPEAID